MFCTLSGRSLRWNTPVFSRFTSREHAKLHRLPFFSHSCASWSPRGEAPKVLWAKVISKRSKELKSDPGSCPGEGGGGGAGNGPWSYRFLAFHVRSSSRTIASMCETVWEQQQKEVRLRSDSTVWSDFAFGPVGNCFLCCNQFFVFRRVYIFKWKAQN